MVKISLIAGLNVGRETYRLLKQRGEDIRDVFVLDEKFSTKGRGFVRFDDIVDRNKLHKVRRIKDEKEKIAEINPDLIIVTGFSQIIPEEILEVPKLGTVGFHYAVLPDRRGCSPVIWAIVNGLEETGVSMFYYDNGIDTGDIIDIERFPIEYGDDSKSVLDKCERSVIGLLEKRLEEIKEARAPRLKQEGPSIYTRKRSEKDGEISLAMNSLDIYNLVRALRPPYPGAHTYCGNGEKLYVLNVGVCSERSIDKERIIDWSANPSEISRFISENAGGFCYTKDSAIKITETRVGGINE